MAKETRMARRCCCGKVVIGPEEDAWVNNDYQHEPLGPKDNFCGPRLKHELRDQQRVITDAREILEDVLNELCHQGKITNGTGNRIRTFLAHNS